MFKKVKQNEPKEYYINLIKQYTKCEIELTKKQLNEVLELRDRKELTRNDITRSI